MNRTSENMRYKLIPDARPKDCPTIYSETITHPLLVITLLLQDSDIMRSDRAPGIVRMAIRNIAATGTDAGPFIKFLETDIDAACDYYAYAVSMYLCRKLVQKASSRD